MNLTATAIVAALKGDGMNAVAVDTLRRRGRIDILHHLLFHGDATRADVKDVDSPTHFIGDDLSSPLLLSRSGLFFPMIFKPYNSLVVNEAVKKRLTIFDGVQFAPTRYSKLVDCWYPPGDFTYYDSAKFLKRPHFYRSDKVLERFPDVPALHENAPACHELVAFNVFPPSNDEKARSVSFVMAERENEKIEFVYPEGLIEKWPVLWGSAVIIRRDVFDLISDCFDEDFFALTEFSL